MTTKWTKGWQVSPNGSGYDIRDFSGNICTTYAHSSEEANAQLIASAPALYEALMLVRDSTAVLNHLDPEHLETIESALRQARGEDK